MGKSSGFGNIFEDIGDVLGVAAAPFTGGLSLIPSAFDVASQATGNNVLGDIGTVTGLGLGAADIFDPGALGDVSADLGPIGSGLQSAGQTIGAGENALTSAIGLGNFAPVAGDLSNAAGITADSATQTSQLADAMNLSPVTDASAAGGITTDAAAALPTVGGGVAGNLGTSLSAIDASLGNASIAGSAANPVGSSPTIAAAGGNAGAGGGGASAAGITGAAGPAATSTSTADWLKANAKWLVPTVGGAIGLGRQLFTPQGSGVTNESNVAADLNALVPQANAATQAQLQGQIAAIRAKYAGLGESGSTAEGMDIATAQNQSLGAQFSIDEGAYAAAGQAYGTVAQAQTQEDQDLSSAISDFGLAAGLGFATSK